jgi:glycerophosphoryl diester phosphodiesterase
MTQDKKAQRICVLSHRGLEPTNENFYPESSYEAFRAHLKRGYSLELDINFCRDEIIISHDTNLKRLLGIDKELKDIYYKDIKDIQYGQEKKGHICTLKQILQMINTKKNILCAFHLKGNLQDKNRLTILAKQIKKCPDAIKSILIFDLYPESAKYLKDQLPHINLGCSVANSSDIKKYNKRVYGTLLSLSDAITYKRKAYYNWVILDEWESTELKHISENLYTKEVFALLKKEGYNILSIFPELHDEHADNANNKRLFKRMYKILELGPHAICTNYPAEIYPYIKQKGGYKFK